MYRSWFSRRAGNFATADLEIDPSNSSDEKDNRPTKSITNPASWRLSGEIRRMRCAVHGFLAGQEIMPLKT